MSTSKNKEKAIARLDINAAIKSLKESLVSDTEGIASFVLSLIRYYFHTLNYQRCLKNGLKNLLGIEVPFNALLIMDLERQVNNFSEVKTKADLLSFIKYSMDSKDKTKALAMALVLKYGKKHLALWNDYQTVAPKGNSYELSMEEQLVWLRKKIKLEKTILKDMFKEIVPFNIFNIQQVKEREEFYTEGGKYPKNFIADTFVSIYD